MTYKTIMTLVTAPDTDKSALSAAIARARADDAHLEVLCLGIDHTQTGYYYAGANALLLQETLKRAQDDAAEIEAAVKKRLSAEDIRWSCESAVAQIAGLSDLVAQRARFADLVVMHHPYGEERGIADEAAVEAALFDGKTPLLIPAEGRDMPGRFTRIVVGWNNSVEALTAIRAGMPLLREAETVSIAIIDPPQHGPDRSDPGGPLSEMLSRHGVNTEISVLARTMPRISDVIERHMADFGADLLVIGAYSHSRFREAIMGGTTRGLLERAAIPVFMAH